MYPFLFIYLFIFIMILCYLVIYVFIEMGVCKALMLFNVFILYICEKSNKNIQYTFTQREGLQEVMMAFSRGGQNISTCRAKTKTPPEYSVCPDWSAHTRLNQHR